MLDQQDGSIRIDANALADKQTPKNTKGLVATTLLTLVKSGRCERIRTFDPLHPMQVRYQAAPHTDQVASIALPDCNFPCALEARSQQIPKFNQLAS